MEQIANEGLDCLTSEAIHGIAFSYLCNTVYNGFDKDVMRLCNLRDFGRLATCEVLKT